jgi:hypothetical protein
MPSRYDIDTDNIPYAFSKVQEAADLPTDISGPAMYDMLYGGLSLEESIEDHWGSGLAGDDPFDYAEIESRDPYALEKSMYQQQIEMEFGFTPPETPYGPSLDDEEAEAVLNAYPGARAIMDDFDASVEGWDSHFDDVEEVLRTSGEAFKDMVDAADFYATQTGTLDTVDDLYANMGEAVNTTADDDLSLRLPVFSIAAGGMGGGWDVGDIVSSVTDAAKGIGNWVKRRFEDVGEVHLAGMDTELREMAEDSHTNRTFAEDLEREGASGFAQQMNDSILGPDPYHTVEQYERFVSHLVAQGTYPEMMVQGIADTLTGIKNAGTVTEGDPLTKTSLTDYDSVMPTPGPADTWPDYGDPASIDYGDPTEFEMDVYGPSGLGLSFYEREGPESIRELLERDVADDDLGTKEVVGTKGDPRPEERLEIINDLMNRGATREGAEYVVDEALGPNTMRNALALHYIMRGMSPDDALETVGEHDLPADPTTPGKGAGGGLTIEEFEDQQKEYAREIVGVGDGEEKRPEEKRPEEKRPEEEEADRQKETRWRDPFADVYRTPSEKSFYDMFAEEFNKRPASGSFGAQRLIPTMSSDAETLYHLQQTPSKRDIAYGQYYGSTGDYKIKDDPATEHVMIDSEKYPRYAQTFLNQNPFSDAFYGDVLRFRDSMDRFRGIENDATAAQAFEAGTLLDKNNNPVRLGPGERAEDTLHHRQNFMDMADGKAQNRLATLVALYNTPVGADRYSREKVKEDYSTTLSKWLSINRSPEDFLNAFVQPKQKRNIPEAVLPSGFPTEL